MVDVPPSAKRLLHHDYHTLSGQVIHKINVYKQSHDKKTFFNQQVLPRVQAISLIFASAAELFLVTVGIPIELICSKQRTFTKMGLNALTLLITSIFRIIFNSLPEVDYISNRGLAFLVRDENSKCIEHILQSQKERILNTPGATETLLRAAFHQYMFATESWGVTGPEETRKVLLDDIRKLTSFILELDPVNSYDCLSHLRWMERYAPEPFAYATLLLEELVEKRQPVIQASVLEATPLIAALGAMVADFAKEDVKDFDDDPFIPGNFTKLITTKDADHVIEILQAKKAYLQKYPDVTEALFRDTLLQYCRLTVFAEDLEKEGVPQLPQDELTRKQNDLKKIMLAIIEINPNIKSLEPLSYVLGRIVEFFRSAERLRAIRHKYAHPPESYNKLSHELFGGSDV